MKRTVIFGFILAILFTLTACKATPTTVLSSSDQSQPIVTEKEIDKGILITTKHYILTLPELWKNNYKLEWEESQNGYTLNFIEPISQQECGGLIFSLMLSPAIGEKLIEPPHSTPITYLGGLYVPEQGMFSLCYVLPTDVQFTQETMNLYMQLQDTTQEILASVTLVHSNSYFYPVGSNTFEQRAKLTTHTERGAEVIQTYLSEKEPNLQLEYLGIGLDNFKIKSSTINNNGDYGYHIYVPKNEKGVYYGVPFNETEGTIPIVCKMTEYPNMVEIWFSQSPETIAYHNFLAGMVTTATEDLGGYELLDLDLDGTKELLHNNSGILTVYGYQNRSVVKLDSYQYETGTMTFYYTKPDPYEKAVYTDLLPGLFTRWIGGGQNHYGYLTLENGKIVNTLLWDENYSSLPNTPPTTNHTKDDKLIEASKIAYEQMGFANITHVYKDILKENPND